MKELIALAKSKPGALTMGQTNGSPNHLADEVPRWRKIVKAAGMRME